MHSSDAASKRMSPLRLLLVTALAMLAFAANSLLCREALASGLIDAASFTLIRLLSGALMLALLVLLRHRRLRPGGSWRSALALFGYAAAFSFAYVSLSAGTGALLLFAAVQITMIVYGLASGERLYLRQAAGAALAAAGLLWLLLPGVTAPPLPGALLMLVAGVSWGVYSLLGRRVAQPTIATAGNFIRAVPFALLLLLALGGAQALKLEGVGYALASGALASALGYVLWYAVLPSLPATTAATVQLSVPVIAALGGVWLLDEALTMRLLLCAVAVLGGIALFIGGRRAAAADAENSRSGAR